MTAGEVLAAVDQLRPNQYDAERKLRWLRRLDGQLLLELEATHRQNKAIRSGDSLAAAASTDDLVLPPPAGGQASDGDPAEAIRSGDSLAAAAGDPDGALGGEASPSGGGAEQSEAEGASDGGQRPEGASELLSRLPDPYTADTELPAPFPYDEALYTAWLFCQIDLHNGEIGKYNQSLALFQSAWRSLADHLNRTRRPCGEGRWKL